MRLDRRLTNVDAPRRTLASDLAEYVVRASFDDLSFEARAALKVRVIDALGCAVAALDAEPIAAVRAVVDDFGGNALATLIGSGRSSPDRAAFYNGALVRYLDFNDAYLAPGETCHPSDNLAPVLAAAEYAGASGETFLTALAVAYHVECRLSDVAPVRDRGFDHTTQGALAVAAGVSRVLELSSTRTMNALAIAGVNSPALRVTRTGTLSNWKGLAFANTAFSATYTTFLARQSLTGPPEVFEGNKGWMEVLSGPFTIDWRREDLERVTRTILKRYDGEIHGQSAVEAALELRAHPGFSIREIERIEIHIFDVAHEQIIGGGEEGDKSVVSTREQADHSLPYMVAVALLDGQLMPEQYASERLERPDVQALLRRVCVQPDPDLSGRFPAEHPCRLRIQLRDGRVLGVDKSDYEGFLNRPMQWESAVAKFERLARPFTDGSVRRAIIDAVAHLEDIDVSELCAALARVRRTPHESTEPHGKTGTTGW